MSLACSTLGVALLARSLSALAEVKRRPPPQGCISVRLASSSTASTQRCHSLAATLDISGGELFPGGTRRASVRLPGLGLKMRAEEVLDDEESTFKGKLDSAVAAGVNIVILEDTKEESLKLYEAARILMSVLRGRAQLLVSERVDIASAANTDGVLLSDQGLPSVVARKMMQNAMPDAVVLPLVARRVSTSRAAEIATITEGADVLMLPVSGSAADAARMLESMSKRVKVPVFLELGTAEAAPELFEAGADGLVFSSLPKSTNVSSLLSSRKVTAMTRNSASAVSLQEQVKRIVEEERILLSSAVDIVRDAAPEMSEVMLLVETIKQLDDPFLLVVVGEFNSGKSSVINHDEQRSASNARCEDRIRFTDDRMSLNGLGGFMRRSSQAPQSRMDYVKLQSRSNSSFPPPHKTQLPPRYHLSLNHGSSASPHSSRQSWKRRFWGAITILALVLAAAAFVSLVKQVHQQQLKGGYAIVIDAGSSGSRIHVFRYAMENRLPVVDTKDLASLKAKPGLSSFSADPERAGDSLVELVDFANAKVPEKERGQTRLYLMATAGLRRLDKSVQEKILESCRQVLRRSQFLFEDSWASVISGHDEGAFAWVSANYALGTLGGDPHVTTGIVELGGASAQVTFVPDVSPPPEFRHTLEYGGVTYHLYTYSFLHLGQEAAWEALMQLLLSGDVKSSPSLPDGDDGVVVDPCTPSGYVMSRELLERYSMSLLNRVKISSVQSAGNFTECRRVAHELLKKGHEQCLHERCAIGSIFVPELRGKFFATENFFYTSEFFGLPATTSLAEVESAGRFYCGEKWLRLKRKHSKMEDEDLLKYCFSTAYIVALLHDRLGIAMNDDRVRFTNKVGTIPLDWALGALIVKLSGNLEEEQQGQGRWQLGDDWVTILSFFGLFGLVCALVWLILRYRTPRLKTIYDLEKGRYITTAAAARLR